MVLYCLTHPSLKIDLWHLQMRRDRDVQRTGPGRPQLQSRVRRYTRYCRRLEQLNFGFVNNRAAIDLMHQQFDLKKAETAHRKHLRPLHTLDS